MNTRLLASSSLLALAACSGNSADGRWSDVDREHLFRAFEAASGVDSGAATLEALGDATSTDCPRVRRSGSTITVTGGCSNAGGLGYHGSFTAENLPISGAPTPYDASKPTRIHFDEFTIDLPYPTVYDGDVDYLGDSLSTDLDASINGILVHSDLTYTVSPDGAIFTAEPGSSIDVDGFGAADVSGTWAFPENEAPGQGTITLVAAQTLVVDLSNQPVDECYAATIVGQGGTWACTK